MQKRIFITGAAGFIGFHFAKACLEAGHQVTAIDNFNSYYSVSLKEDRAKLLRQMGLEVQRLDLSEKERLCQLMSEKQVSHIVHLAAQAGVRYSFTHPESYVKSNIEGFLHILEACRVNPQARLIYASSSSVYGSNSKIPFALDDQTDHQTNVYGVSKKTNELLAHSYHYLYGIASIGLRFFTVYGPWGRPDMAYYAFTKAVFEGRAIEVYNEGQCRRDFTYVDDVISAMLACLDCEQTCALFNIGNERPETVSYLIELIEQQTKKKAQKIFLPMQQGEILQTFADIKQAKESLGFQPKTLLAEGISRFVDWYRNYYPV